jgi:ATP-dependent DNA ligase
VLAGTGARPVMFKTDVCRLPGLAITEAATLRPPARFDASVVPGAKPAPFRGFVEPCHPALREEAPSGGRWFHEIKLDGYRTQAHLQAGRPAIYTRAGYDWTLRFQLAALPAQDLILDAEVVVADSRGVPDFGLPHDGAPATSGNGGTLQRG